MCSDFDGKGTTPCIYLAYQGLFHGPPYTDLLVEPVELRSARGYNQILGWTGQTSDDCYYGQCNPNEVVDICISAARPDMLAGVLTVAFAGDEFVRIQDYPLAYFEYPFLYLVTPHYSWDQDGPSEPGPDCPGIEAPEDASSWWGYFSNYDTAWPWDDITDPFVRQAVYDMYYPCNL